MGPKVDYRVPKEWRGIGHGETMYMSYRGAREGDL